MIFKGEVMKRITQYKKPKVSYLRSSLLFLSALGFTTSVAVASDFSGEESYKPPVTQNYRPSIDKAPFSVPTQKSHSQFRPYAKPYSLVFPYGFTYVQPPMRSMFQPRRQMYPFGGHPPFFGNFGGYYYRLIPITTYGLAQRPYISEQNEQSRDKPLK
jgi:hypothetical protein